MVVERDDELINISKDLPVVHRAEERRRLKKKNTGTALSKKQDIEHVFLEFTKSICPDCREMVDAHVLARNGKVYMEKEV